MTVKDRREFLKLLGGGAAFASLAACGGSEEPARPATSDTPAEASTSPAANQAATTDAAPEPAAVTTAEPQLVPLADDDPQAKALAYVSDASRVDREAQPRFEDGQACANCVLFMGAEGDANGACSIFPGRLVAATGWCSVYAPKGG